MASAFAENKPNFVKGIGCFISDLSYREAIENSVNYNTRLCIERRMRMPFLDTQTGVAQTHSSLLMHERQRMPGLNSGQVYTYPSKRWRKKRRQYLLNSCNNNSISSSIFNSSKRKESVLNSGGESGDTSSFNIDLHTGDSQNAISNNEDSKDSLGTNTNLSKDDQTNQNSSNNKVSDQWYYDEFEMQEMEGFEEPDADSDYDYEESYTKRKKRKGSKPGRSNTNNEGTSGRRSVKGSASGRGRKKGMSGFIDLQDPDKPYACDLCGARYKTRPGLTYHYTHSHKDKPADNVPAVDEEASQEGGLISNPVSPQTNQYDHQQTTTGPSTSSNNSSSTTSPAPHSKRMSARMTQNIQNTSPVVLLNENDVSTSATTSTFSPVSTPHKANKPIPREGCGKGKSGGNNKSINPSPYCDFCLGDSVSNKSGQPEILISCSDCGRSGHPTCLQFTANMIISVGKYRWQCIECKCCSICGTSDNDDQLLFCDDCDRGYHVYCLTPPLTSPPEGCWSCQLCVKEFHSN
ncbi:zinc finger protein ubi-d4 A isoform X2 [Daktulosphaira vitifoliae]|uniref:zinc finger protein ubi-d4 A isoform X2 n=1 Tax=Daktulosphaira vitifoliae TaxID=58002 RepID=UPI0021AA0808|nr:zinc finger protein ubi-d4 A isoform X2 [Daktulosphaira vitifoliae]